MLTILVFQKRESRAQLQRKKPQKEIRKAWITLSWTQREASNISGSPGLRFLGLIPMWFISCKITNKVTLKKAQLLDLHFCKMFVMSTNIFLRSWIKEGYTDNILFWLAVSYCVAQKALVSVSRIAIIWMRCLVVDSSSLWVDERTENRCSVGMWPFLPTVFDRAT